MIVKVEYLPEKIQIPVKRERAGVNGWPLGTTCRRDKRVCESYLYDYRCLGRTCPFKV